MGPTMKYVLLMMFVLTNTTAIKASELEAVDALIKRYKVTAERPKSCPLESRKFADLLAKTETIKNVFKSNCLQKDDNKMSEVLNSVKDIQDELKRRNIIEKTIDGQTIVNAVIGSDGAAAASTNSTTTTSTNSTTSSGSSVSALSGIKFSTLFSNITTMIKKNQCNLDDGRVLQMTADLIYDSTQLGLLSGSEVGLIVAGGGFIVSSALRLIDMIFKQRFDFEKNQDRQTFIKLNCSFYDIRKDLEAQGALDVENNSSRDDLKEAKDLIEKTTLSLKSMEQEKIDQKKVLDSLDHETLISLVGDISLLKKNLSRIKIYLANGIVDSVSLPGETQKLMMISQLAQDYDLLVTLITHYKSLKVSSIPMLDDLFLMELKKFDPLDPIGFNQVLNSNANDFNSNQRAKVLFHVTRILNDISAKEELAGTTNLEVKKLRIAELQKRQEQYTAKLAELKKIEEKLIRVVTPREYSANDDGSDNLLSILENYKSISEQIYGEWGEKFLKYTTLKSYEETKILKEKLDRFNTKYAEKLKTFSVDSTPSPYICQDIQRIRVSYKYADSLVQEGYDFIVTNKDLFHTDSRNYYNASLDEETGIATGSIEKIQRHYKSTILALRKLRKEEIDPADEAKYLTRSFGGSAYIGKSMLDVSAAKVLTRAIQERFDQLSCNKVLVDDLH